MAEYVSKMVVKRVEMNEEDGTVSVVLKQFDFPTNNTIQSIVYRTSPYRAPRAGTFVNVSCEIQSNSPVKIEMEDNPAWKG
jgi:hypothetical protein